MMMIVLRRLPRLLPLLGPLNEVFFRGRDVGGFVDSWPETLVPSASNRSTTEWTLVDSGDPAKGESANTDFAPAAAWPRYPMSGRRRLLLGAGDLVEVVRRLGQAGGREREELDAGFGDADRM